MADQNKRKRVQNLLSFMGLVSGVSNYTTEDDLAVDEEDMIVVPPYDFFKDSEDRDD